MRVFNNEARRSLIGAMQEFLVTSDTSLIRGAVATARASVGRESSPQQVLRELHDLMEEVPALAEAPVDDRATLKTRLVEACVSAYYARI
jgi:hypothetical protein